jgi:hypothetical protein
MGQIFTENTLKGIEQLSNTISVPQSPDIRAYQGVINQIPEFDQPKLFGLPSNIDRSVQRVNST